MVDTNIVRLYGAATFCRQTSFRTTYLPFGCFSVQQMSLMGHFLTRFHPPTFTTQVPVCRMLPTSVNVLLFLSRILDWDFDQTWRFLRVDNFQITLFESSVKGWRVSIWSYSYTFLCTSESIAVGQNIKKILWNHHQSTLVWSTYFWNLYFK